VKVLDLFSGIGGFSRGLEAAGPFETIAFVEYEPYCQAVLKHHWPRTKILGDIKNVKKEDIPTRPDVIVGGFPCQPFSVAGSRQAQDDPRHLWPDMFRLIQELRPDWVIGENVAGLINLGLDEVLTDLENAGYTTRTFNIPACAVGAPHQRYRLWIVANLHSGSEPEPTRPEQQGFDFGDVGNTEHNGLSSDQGRGGVLHKPEEPEGTNTL
jgi:DNA (cytosine-5)-methyltransferase 1